MGNKDEQRLLTHLQAGSEQALTTLYERLSPHVYALLLRLLGSQADANEILQDTFVTLHEKAHLYDPARGSVRAFTYTMARNLALTRLKARQSHLDKIARLADEQEGQAPPPPEDALLTKIFVQDALEHLSRENRELLEYAFVLGMSHQQLSTHFGLPLGTVKSKLRRSLLHLREVMEPK